jgi:hypothetical protein
LEFGRFELNEKLQTIRCIKITRTATKNYHCRRQGGTRLHRPAIKQWSQWEQRKPMMILANGLDGLKNHDSSDP